MVREEFDELSSAWATGWASAMPEVPLEEAAGIVAGGIRFAVQNGFRLPAHYPAGPRSSGASSTAHADLSASA